MSRPVPTFTPAFAATLLAAATTAAQEVPPAKEPAAAAEDPATEGEGEYRTPLAGSRLEARVFGREVVVEERDRSVTTAVNLGGAFFAPSVGGATGVPIFALYSRGYLDGGRRYRLVASVLVNTFDFAQDLGGPEILLRLENNTVPFARTVLVDGEDPDAGKREWGRASAWLGLGYRWPVSPGNVDNHLRLGLYYHGGYAYHDRGDDTPDSSVIAKDTYVHGLRFQGRVDMIQRNLLELPHRGVAGGFDLELTRRDHWDDFGEPGLVVFDEDDTRDYLKLEAYLVAAGGLPGLSERHRWMVQVHAGWAPTGTLDRHSAFQLLGGPIPSEASDLARPPFPGATFDDFPLGDYLVATAEYRLELLFFLYLHLRGSWGLARRPTFDGGGRIRFRRAQDYAVHAAITSGFPFESQLYLEVGYNFTGKLRAGQEGTSFLLMWSKSF